MPALRLTAALAIMAAVALPEATFAEPRAEARVPAHVAVIVSAFEGRAIVVSGDRLLAVAPLPEQPAQARRRWTARIDPYGRYGAPCGYYGCPDARAGYYGAPPEFVLSGPDLRLVPFGHAALPAAPGARADDPARDHWRILYERTGRLETNPSPLIASAALLAPLKDVDPTTTASLARPLHIEITRRNERMVTVDVQKLLAALGEDAGPADGVAGPMTRAAIRRFQERRGIEPTGRITASLIEALYRAADKQPPVSGRIVATSGGRTIIDEPVAIDEPHTPLGTHVLMLAKTGAGPDWHLLALSPRLARQLPPVFGKDRDGDPAATAREALARLRMPAEIRARLGRLAAPGTVLVVADESALGLSRQPPGPFWR